MTGRPGGWLRRLAARAAPLLRDRLDRLVGWRRDRAWPRLSVPLVTATVAALALLMPLAELGRQLTREPPARVTATPAPAQPDPSAPAALAADPAADAFVPAAFRPGLSPTHRLGDLLPTVIEPAAGPRPVAAASASRLPEVPPAPAGLEDVALELQRQRDAMLQLEASLSVREAALRAAEADLAAQLDRLEALRGELQALVGAADAEAEERLLQLVKMYESMRAKSAAAIFDRLELPVLLQVAKRMREAKMAAILAAMDPNRARVVTSELARERALPRLD